MYKIYQNGKYKESVRMFDEARDIVEMLANSKSKNGYYVGCKLVSTIETKFTNFQGDNVAAYVFLFHYANNTYKTYMITQENVF